MPATQTWSSESRSPEHTENSDTVHACDSSTGEEVPGGSLKLTGCQSTQANSQKFLSVK